MTRDSRTALHNRLASALRKVSHSEVSATEPVRSRTSRREFLQLTSAVVSLIHANAYGRNPYTMVRNGRSSAVLHADGRPLWEVDASWLAGNPVLDCEQ